MKPYLLAVAVATLALAACKREAEPAPAPEPAVVAPAETAEPAAATDATAVIEHASPAGDVAFDTKGFAGTFGAAGSSLEIAADGTYRLSAATQGSDDGLQSQGTWTVEADGKQILLDPDSKAEADRRYDIVTHDELRALDGGPSLRREASGG